MRNKNIFIPIVTEEGEIIGRSTRNECHSGTFILHPVFHLHVFNPIGELYLQRKAVSSNSNQTKWEASIEGHVEYGVEMMDALCQKEEKELNMIDTYPVFAFKYPSRTEKEYELVHTYCTIYHGIIIPDNKEVLEGKFWKMSDIEANLGKDIFTPNFEHEFRQLINIVR